MNGGSASDEFIDPTGYARAPFKTRSQVGMAGAKARWHPRLVEV